MASRSSLFRLGGNYLRCRAVSARHAVASGPGVLCCPGISARDHSQASAGPQASHTPAGRWGWGAVVAGAGALGLACYLKEHIAVAKCAEKEEAAGARKAGLPDLRLDDVQKHKTKDTGIWVTFNNGVYDITEFMEGHPGGDKILLAAGGQLEPFWNMYAVHKNKDVFEILEELRIGNIHPDDMKEVVYVKTDDPFSMDPKRHPALRINAAKPFNAETPPELLVDHYITPNELFFVRNHLPVARVDPKTFRLTVGAEDSLRPGLNLSLEDLKVVFKKETITATIQCAGNRRSNMRKFKEVKGLDWGFTAISNAKWTGVKLSEVLEAAGLKEEDWNHIIFEGLDKDIEGVPYEASIPAEIAFDPRKEVLLAWEMNDQEIPVDHGFPLRVIVPGVVGARQVKWVGRIIASKEESKSHWQQKDYKSFSPSTDWHNADFSKAVPIQEYPIQSAICEPLEGAVIQDAQDGIPVRGYAWSGGGRGIIRVEVSCDKGKTWHEATMHRHEQRRNREWAWVLWEINVPLPKDNDGKPVEIICKAIDTSHNCQPESAEGIWNLRGLIHNAWHTVNVTVSE